MMLFSNGGHNYYNGFDDEENVDYYYSSSPSVDCTLSLGTPSTHSSGNDKKKRSSIVVSGFGWNILQSKHTSSPPPAPAVDSHRAGGDPLLARRCANCDTTSTPLWRNGPRGPKSLCNACGIRFKKEERRATAGSAGSTSSGGVDGSNWAVQPPQRIPCFPASSGYGSSNEYQFIEGHEDHHHHLHQYYQYYNHRHDSVDHTNYPFLSWRFNGEAKSRA